METLLARRVLLTSVSGCPSGACFGLCRVGKFGVFGELWSRLAIVGVGQAKKSAPTLALYWNKPDF